jgi:hypothetical protein
MRRTFLGLATAGLLAVIGCSDSDVGGGQAASGGGSAEEFCTEFQALDERFADDPDASIDDVISALESLDPPAEIADDFQEVLDVARESAELDPSDSEAIAEFQETAEESVEAEQRVTEFLDEECDVPVENG